MHQPNCLPTLRALRFWTLTLAALGLLATPIRSATPTRPNVVVIFCDDMGYADVGCYGAQGFATPHLDRMAREGMRFTDFYVPQAVCSASRAALLTGCYPNRVGIFGALGPGSPLGLHTNEVTLADLLKSRGYATAMYGKWHLGRPPELLPTRQGFDDYFGLPYSNDMWPHHPTGGAGYPPLPLLEGERVAQLMPDQTQLTTWYTERAVKFIAEHARAPFFLYVAHNMPHVPLFVSDKFKGKTSRGLYGDVIAEIDWSVGEILAALKQHGLDEKTLVIFTSDNGPWLLYGNHAGSAGPLREGKATAFDGGQRVPCIVRWPGQVPAGQVCRELATTLDLLPTLARLAEAPRPQHRIIDGRDIWPLMAGQPGAKSPHEAFYFYWGRHLQAVRSGPWKLHFPHAYPQPSPPGTDGQPGKYATRKIETALFNLADDVSETNNVAAQHPEVVQRLTALADRAREDLGDSTVRRTGRGVRPPGRAHTNTTAILAPLDGAIPLLAAEATLHGQGLRFDAAAHAVRGWTRADEWMSWDFAPGRAGAFLVEVVQSCPPGRGGGELELDFGDQTLTVKVEENRSAEDFVSRHIGKVNFAQAGKRTLNLKARQTSGDTVLAVRSVTLWPVEK